MCVYLTKANQSAGIKGVYARIQAFIGHKWPHNPGGVNAALPTAVMRTHKHLFSALTDFDNLLQAAQKAQKGKRFKPTVSPFLFRLEPEFLRLQRELSAKIWQPRLKILNRR